MGLTWLVNIGGTPVIIARVDPDWVSTPLFLNLTCSLEQHTELARRYEVNTQLLLIGCYILG